MHRNGLATIGSLTVAAFVLAVAGCSTTAVSAKPTFAVSDNELPEKLVLIAYGDMRFTDPSETAATQPAVRRALIAKVAAEHPAAIFLNGDLPWHGVPEDYAVYRDETKVWRDEHLRVYPALGNHEFSQCEESQCLEYWWNNFPELRDRRWYSVALGSKILMVALDSNAPLVPGSEQRAWLERQIAALSRRVRFVLIVLHHPPVADLQTGARADHNPRANELSLAQYLGKAAHGSRARFFVSAGHVHNYERFLQDGVVYLVSGGGGAHPSPVERAVGDLYQTQDFPNYHYVRLELRGTRLVGEMIRLGDYAAAAPGAWETGDRFELSPPP
jgi:hypothetical protein